MILEIIGAFGQVAKAQLIDTIADDSYKSAAKASFPMYSGFF